MNRPDIETEIREHSELAAKLLRPDAPAITRLGIQLDFERAQAVIGHSNDSSLIWVDYMHPMSDKQSIFVTFSIGLRIYSDLGYHWDRLGDYICDRVALGLYPAGTVLYLSSFSQLEKRDKESAEILWQCLERARNYYDKRDYFFRVIVG